MSAATLPAWTKAGHRAWRPTAEWRALARGMRGPFSMPAEQWHEAGCVAGTCDVVPEDARRAGIVAVQFLRSDGVAPWIDVHVIDATGSWTRERYLLETFFVIVNEPGERHLREIEEVARIHLDDLLEKKKSPEGLTPSGDFG